MRTYPSKRQRAVKRGWTLVLARGSVLPVTAKCALACSWSKYRRSDGRVMNVQASSAPSSPSWPTSGRNRILQLCFAQAICSPGRHASAQRAVLRHRCFRSLPATPRHLWRPYRNVQWVEDPLATSPLMPVHQVRRITLVIMSHA